VVWWCVYWGLSSVNGCAKDGYVSGGSMLLW